MFKSLDEDRDGKLSRAEMQDLLDKTAQHNAAQGVDEGGDFFATLDADADGFVDKTEAASFIAAVMKSAGGGSKPKARDEL